MYEPDRHDVEALRDTLLGDLLAEPDSLRRYHGLSKEQVLYDALVSEIKRMRGQALAAMVAAGHSQREVAQLAGLGSQQRVHQLVAAGKGHPFG
jgi:hypothetical protein